MFEDEYEFVDLTALMLPNVLVATDAQIGWKGEASWQPAKPRAVNKGCLLKISAKPILNIVV